MGTYSFSGKAEFVTVGATGIYDITAYGAKGGNNGSISGGSGAEYGGNFALTAGEHLEIIVGGAGGSTSDAGAAGSGGGGTFVLGLGTGDGSGNGSYTPLLVAGGGGGAYSGGHASVAGGAELTTGKGSGQGGAAGGGSFAGAGGAGIKSNGQSTSSAVHGGKNGSNGGGYAGGGGTGTGLSLNGGFGGGGASYGGGGGGGGYTGGNGGYGGETGGAGLGGTSFDSAGTPLVAQSASAENAAHGGNGAVVISMIVPATTLVTFNGTGDGAAPQASLVADSNGNLFGTTKSGGASGDGALFELKNIGTLAAPVYASTPTVVLSFNSTDGANPDGSLIIDSNGNLFGTASAGGSGFGLMFEMKNTGTLAAPTYGTSPVQELKLPGSGDPVGSLIVNSHFNLYGTTKTGGANGDGSVFLMANVGTLAAPVYPAADYFTLASFTGTGNGANPTGSLIADAKGDFYGTTSAGGANGDGTVFELAVSSTSSTGYTAPITLATFNGTGNGATPDGSLITDAAGDLFGTTKAGSANGDGTVFELVNTGTASAPAYASGAITLATFNGTGDGAGPQGSLIIDAAGDLFGTASAGGANGDGTVFEIADTGGVYSSTPITVATFTGTGDGANPLGSLTADAAGNLYGTTSAGGANGSGTAFEITNSGFVSIQTLVTFNTTDGAGPHGSLMSDAAGDLFGTTFFGGDANGDGTVFELKNTGTVAAPAYSGSPTTLVAFNQTDGANPQGSLIADAAGDLFGTTYLRGAGGAGTVFELKNTGTVAAPAYAGTPTTLISFNGTNGGGPQGSLIADAAGDLFGTTYIGGDANSDGTVFELKNTGTVAAPAYSSTPTTLVAFNQTDGQAPLGSLIADAAGDLFGTTSAQGNGNGKGTVFELKNTGTVAAPVYASTPTTLVAFNNTDGNRPVGSLIADANGDLFGTTSFGGSDGTVFELKNTGTVAAPVYASTPTTLVAFNNTDGQAPDGSLISDAAGDLFGTTTLGGAYGKGTIFELKNLGTLAAPIYANTPTVTVSFNGTDGATLDGDLNADAAGHLYGTTSGGGDANGDGTVFEVTGLTFVQPSIVVGTAASISAKIDAIAANPDLALILVTDPADPVTVTFAQFTTDAAALGKLGGTYSLLVTGVTGQSYTSFEYDFSAGVFMTADYFYPASGQPYSSYEYVYSAGAAFIGSKFFYTGITGQAYTGEEIDYTTAGSVTRQDFTGVTGAAYSSYEYDYVGGVLAGKKFDFTTVPSGATYNSYVQDYSAANAFTGEQFFFTGVTGQPYTVQEDDFDANQQLSAIKLNGFAPASPYSSLELDYAAGTYDAFKVFYTGQSGQFADLEEDATSANVVTKVVYSDPTNPSATPYTSVEQDYTGGALTDAIYDFSNVSGASYYGYQVKDDASGAALTETLDNNDGSHTLYALASNQTLTSISDDTFVGGAFANDTFVFQPIYGADTIADFGSHLTGAGHDTIQFSTSEFANFGAMIAAAQNVGGNVVVTAPTGDTLTLDNLTTTQLSANQGDFTFHA